MKKQIKANRTTVGYTVCIREVVLSRLQKQGMATLRLPLSFSGRIEQHVPIMVSTNLSKASRIIVVFGEPGQDLGIWAYRSIGAGGINAGSAVSMAEHVLHQQSSHEEKTAGKRKPSSDTALVLANTGQLIWHAAGRKAITMSSWMALSRRSAVDPPPRMTDRNKIPDNESWQDHVECVFDEILAARGKLVRADAKIDVVGIAEGGLGAARYLRSECTLPHFHVAFILLHTNRRLSGSIWHHYISSMVFCNPLHNKGIEIVGDGGSKEAESFRQFLLTRCRAYLLSPEPRGVPIPGVAEHGCNCFSSGEALNIEGITPAIWKDMLQWMEAMYADPKHQEDILDVRSI